MSEDERKLLEKYRSWKQPQKQAFLEISRQAETCPARPAWMYRLPAVIPVYDFALAVWDWLGTAPFAVHFSLRVSMLAFSLLVFLPTHAGSMIVSFGGSLSVNLIYEALRRFGAPGALTLVGLAFAPIIGLLIWAGWILIQVIHNAIRVYSDKIAWDMLRTRDLLISFAVMFLFAGAGMTGLVGTDNSEFLGMDIVFILASAILFTVATFNQILIHSLRQADAIRSDNSNSPMQPA